MATDSDSNIVIAGSLCKRTKFTKKWKKFYWRLLSSGLLYRYKDMKFNKPLGQADIKRDCYDIREGLDASTKVTFPSYIPSSCCFSISLTDKTYYMYADTPASANEWIRALNRTSSVISRRRSETDARFHELERRRIALKNARQRRSKRFKADTMSVDLVLECAEGDLDHLEGTEETEDPYVTILPPSPSHFKSQQYSTSSLLRRSTSVPYILNSNDNNNLAIPGSTKNIVDSMRSLYDESVPAKPLTPIRQPPPPPTIQKSQFEGASIDRRNSFSEDHPTLQRNTHLRETRKAHKGFTSPQITSTTFKIGTAVDDMDLRTSPGPIHSSVIDTRGSPTQSESSVGVVHILRHSNSPISPLSLATSSPSPVVLRAKQNTNTSTPVKRYASKEKIARQKSLPEFAYGSPVSTPSSFVFPVQQHSPVFTSGNSSPAKKPTISNYSRPKKHSLGHRQQSVPDFMALSKLQVANSPTEATNEKDVFSPPLVKRLSQVHQRRKSLSDFMPMASVNAPDNQKMLHKVLGGNRPQSMAAQQAVIAELQIASKMT